MPSSPIRHRRDAQVADLRRHENGCTVRGCERPTAFKRTVEIHDEPAKTAGRGHLVVLGYCARHLDQILRFKERAAA